MGLENVDVFFVENLNESIFQKVTFNDETQSNLIRDNLRFVGKEIMESRVIFDGNYKSRWNEERVANAALGYNNAQQMVFFSTNVPTYTITAFWSNGRFRGNEWIGLFQRTIKD